LRQASRRVSTESSGSTVKASTSVADNVSWHSHAHKIESGFTAALTLRAPLVLALAFRRNAAWRDSWLPSLLTVPAVIAANAVFSAIGDGAAVRAGTMVVFAWLAFVGLRLWQTGDVVSQRP
jgi:hypothetical protein